MSPSIHHIISPSIHYIIFYPFQVKYDIDGTTATAPKRSCVPLTCHPERPEVGMKPRVVKKTVEDLEGVMEAIGMMIDASSTMEEEGNDGRGEEDMEEVADDEFTLHSPPEYLTCKYDSFQSFHTYM